MQDAAGGISCGGGTAAKCDDNVDCTQDSCDPTQGCVHAPLNSGTCTDSGTCGGNATCQQGKCVGMGTPCNDMNPCTQNTCLNGQCTFPMEMLGTACVFDACRTGSTCSANGQCQMGTAINCDDANPCTADSCDPANGCVHQPNNAGTCSDGNACTTADKCVNGTCTGTGIVCTALDECHKAGTCDMTAGGCSDPRQNDGFPCTGGTCQGGRCVLGDGGVVGSGGSAGTGGEAGDTASGGSSASGGSTQTPPAHVFTRNPGGCACTVPVESTSRHGEYLLALALGIGLARRRRDSSTRGSVAAARQRG
jgi:hypothetical protein